MYTKILFLVNLRSHGTEVRKVSSVPLHQRRPYGLHRPRFPPPQHHSRLFLDSLFDRSLWTISSIPTTPSPQILAWPCSAYHIPCRRRWRWGWRNHIWWRLEGSRCGCGPWRPTHLSGDGRMQLVVDWIAEVQERGYWSVGPCTTSHPRAMGLRSPGQLSGHDVG